MEIAQEYFDKYRYSLRGPHGFEYISQPINWDEDNKVFKRSTENHGVFINLANNLEFYVGEEGVSGGYNYIKETYAIYGINAPTMLVKEENISGQWVEAYRGFLDLSTYEQKPYTISVNFNESGLYEKIKARQSEKLELDRLTTMEGTAIEPIPVEEFNLGGRKILILNEWKVTPGTGQQVGRQFFTYVFGENRTSIWLASNQGAEEIQVPISLVVEQSGNAQTIYDYEIKNLSSPGGAGQVFYADAINDNDLFLDFDFAGAVGGSPVRFSLYLMTFKDGAAYTYHSKESIFHYAGGAYGTWAFQLHKKIPIKTGQSLGLLISFENTGGVHFDKLKLNLTEETYYIATKSKFVMPFEALERIINVITDKANALKSKQLGRTDSKTKYKEDGFCSLVGLTNGFWVREFNTEKLTTSFDDFMKSFGAVWQLGYGIEKIGNDESVRVEHVSYFYQDTVTIKIDAKANNIVRRCAKKYFYSALSMGYSKPSGAVLYEEVLGLDEYNIKNDYTTAITRIENKMLNISEYRADSYGTEFARRKPKSKFPEEDTRYDLDMMMQDLKRGTGPLFDQRLWGDDFVIPEPFNRDTTGVFSPSTATNLRMSPMNILLRTGYWIKGGFMKNLTEYVRYSNSNGNSKLRTQLLAPGSQLRPENGNVLNADLHKALFNPEIITFEYPVDTMLMKEITGTVEINGDTIMNYYGLVRFINEYDQFEYGYLLSVEPNGDGKWELLSSTRSPQNIVAGLDCEGLIEPPLNLNATDVTPYT